MNTGGVNVLAVNHTCSTLLIYHLYVGVAHTLLAFAVNVAVHHVQIFALFTIGIAAAGLIAVITL